MNGKRFASKATGLIALTVAAGLILSGCTASGGDSTKLSDKPVTLNFAWWGNDTRNKITNQVIKDFEKLHPNITIATQVAEFDPYWDKIATETAGNNTPDIFQMDPTYIATYGNNGVLYDINDLKGLKLTNFPKNILGTGTVDGHLYGVPNGMIAETVMANPKVLEEAGVAMPDDTKWTWDDMKNIAAQVSAAGKGKYFGLSSWGINDSALIAWIRDHGEHQYGPDGNVAVSEATLTSYWQFYLDLNAVGAVPPPSAIVEHASADLSDTYMATNTSAFDFFSSNQITALRDASGTDIKLLQMPTPDGTPNGSAYLLPSQYFSVSARTQHPAEVALFMDYLLNSTAAANVLLTERGVPGNDKVRAAITPNLGPADQDSIAYMDAVSKVAGDPVELAPPGSETSADLSLRYTQEVMFKKMTPAQAAKGYIKDLQAGIDAAK